MSKVGGLRILVFVCCYVPSVVACRLADDEAKDGGMQAIEDAGGDGDGDGDGDSDSDEDAGFVDAGGGDVSDSGSCDLSMCPSNSGCSGNECACQEGFVDDPWPGRRCLAEPTIEWAEGFEAGFGDWSSEGGVWAVGEPTLDSGPMARSGAQLAGTVLNAPYPNSVEVRLISPTFVVPDAAMEPRFRYWSWHHLRGPDAARVQLRRRTASETWSGWTNLERLTGRSAWTQGIVMLADYANETVQVAFLLDSSNSSDELQPGYYVDEVSLESGPMRLAEMEGFEDGFGDWSSVGAIWTVGEPSHSDGPTPHSGTQLAGTSLDGDYPNSYEPRLVSPAFVVPAASVNPRVRYWSWHDLRDSDAAAYRFDA